MFAISTSSLPPSPKKNQYLGVDGTTGQPAWISAGTASSAAAHSNGSTYLASKSGGGGLNLQTQVAFALVTLLKTASSNANLFAYGDISQNNQYGGMSLRNANPCMGIDVWSSGIGHTLGGVDGPTQINDNKWHLLVINVFYSGHNQQLNFEFSVDGGAYVNAGIQYDWSPNSNASGLGIGDGTVGAGSFSPRPLTGDFSRWAYFSGVRLSTANLTSIYNAYLQSQAAFDTAIGNLSPSIYYHFDETGGTDVVDYAGVNDATYSGAATPAGATTSPFASAVVGPLPNLLSGAGDAVVGGVAGAPSRLARGSPGTFFHVNASTGALEWVAVSTPGAITPPLTSSANITFQPNSVANNVLTLHNAASAVNLLTLTGTATGTDPTLVVSGDANRGLVINPAGTGSITVGGKSDSGVPMVIAGNSATQTGDLLHVLQNPGGNALFTLSTVSSAVNGLTFTAASTGQAVLLSATGTDADVAFALQGKGAGAVQLQPRGLNGLTVASTASAVNYLTVTPAATGSPVTVAASGTDTNVGLTINGKGTGNLLIGTAGPNTIQFGNYNVSSAQTRLAAGGSFIVARTGGVTAFQVADVSSAVNGVVVTDAATTVAPSVAATGSDTNVDLTVSGQGTGVINYGYASTAISGAAAPATLAATTGGATGPATAAQNSWLKVKVNGTVNYIPLWQ